MNYLKMGKDDGQIKKIAKVVKSGGLVVFPFDTCYVFVVDPTNQEAVDKLYEIKGRSINKAVSVAVGDLDMAQKYTKMTKQNLLICQKLLPGPFTMVVEGKHKLAKGIEATDGSLGIRIPDFKPVQDLAKALGVPITATSANVSGQSICHNLASLKNQLSSKKEALVDLWVDGGQLAVRQASTVMDIRGKKIKTLRRGDIVLDKSGKGLVSESVKETKTVAKMIFEKAIKNNSQKPLVFFLTGDLGCGKTVFARKIGRILGIKGKIVSPTFNIINEYKLNSKSETLNSKPFGLTQGKQIQNSNYQIFKQFLHIDLYRIREEEELEELGFLKLFNKNTITCIEWPEVMGKNYFEKLREKVYCVDVSFEYGETKKQRRVWFNLSQCN